MKRSCLLLLVGTSFYAAALVGASRAAEPAHYKLDRVRLEQPSSDLGLTAAQRRCRDVSPQTFQWFLGEGMSAEPYQQEFDSVVKKDRPKYLAKRPLRGVAKLGSQKFAFVLDQKDEKSKRYDRLYFDLNGNGDLTDDRPIDAASTKQLPLIVASYAQSQFPRVDLVIGVDGKKLEYSFFFELTSYGSGDGRFVTASLTAATCWRGEITLDGKKHKITLLDHNSNGRFDDLTSVREDARGADGELEPEYGDMLLFEPEKAASRRLGLAAADESQQFLGRINSLDGKLYEFQVSPRGDELTVTPSAVPLGKVSSPHAPCTLELIGPQGFVALNLEKSGTAEVPAGQWRLLKYTRTVENWQPPAKEDKKKETGKDRLAPALVPGAQTKTKPKGSLWKALQDTFLGPSLDFSGPLYGPATTSLVSAQGTVNGKPIVVAPGQTATLKFGPPYQAAAKLAYVQGGQAELSLLITGADGEVVNDLYINGHRPPKPKIKITGPDGKIVAEGDFEYG